MAIPVEFLSSTPYFSVLSLDGLDSLRKSIFEKKFNRGETILYEDEDAEALYFVTSGAVKIFKTSGEGKEQILAIVRPGESFNDVPVFDGRPNPASAQAMGLVTVYGIRKENLETILREYPQVARNVIQVLAGRVRQLVELVEDLSFRHVIGRVAKILLENSGDRDTPVPRLTQQEMAAMAGTAREVVSRSIRALEEEGLIRLDRHRIVIKDREALEDKMKVSV
ncbi:MAG: Crp/Fnr family transcriptional regulator [Chloroflexi bacterium]|nr:Crp/Fnr family transcriptional regulator [Chloroflexota bacterium]